jgi:hypothetical protein
MKLHKLALLMLALFFTCQMAALSIDELQDLYYENSDSLDFGSEAAAFITQNDNLQELDHAYSMWSELDPEGSAAWLQERTNEQEPQKYLYLKLNGLEDPQEKINQARALIVDHPGFAGGYRGLLLSYLYDFDINNLLDGNTEDGRILREDLPSLATYAATFPDDPYTRLGMVFTHIINGDLEAAKPVLKEAFEKKDAWLDDVDLTQLIPLREYHPLLAYLIGVMRGQDSDKYTKYRIAELAGILMDYYVGQAEDYDAAIAYFSAEPFYWENQYIIFGLVTSYINKGDPDAAIPLLTYNGDLDDALYFQDSWMSYNPNEASTIYNAVLGMTATQPLHAYLLARTLPGVAEKLAKARELAAQDPSLDYGFSLAAETYMKYYATAAADDSLRAFMDSLLAQDAQLMRDYLARFPENSLAAVGNYLVNVVEGNSIEALDAYQKLDQAGLSEYLEESLGKLAIDRGRTGLLLKIKELQAQKKVAQGTLEADAAYGDAVTGYLQTLYDHGRYSLMLEEVAKNPNWMDIPDIQFLIVNAHYFQNDYTQTIATLRYMVEKGTIGTTLLKTLKDDQLNTHPDWQPLMDYAATMPDPDAGADAPSGEGE